MLALLVALASSQLAPSAPPLVEAEAFAPFPVASEVTLPVEPAPSPSAPPMVTVTPAPPPPPPLNAPSPGVPPAPVRVTADTPVAAAPRPPARDEPAQAPQPQQPSQPRPAQREAQAPVGAPTSVSQSAPSAPTAPDDVPAYAIKALGTATVPLSFNGAEFMLGVRGELDIFRVSALISYDRAGTTPFTLSDTAQWTGLVGVSCIATSWARVRILGGVSALAATTTSLGATVALTGRIGFSFIALDAAVTFAPVGSLKLLDARAGLVLKAGPVELQGGYRARFVDASATGTLASLFASTPLAGPGIALGVSL